MTRLVLHLGVVVQPYPRGTKTTGDVAGFLEKRYGVMGKFAQVHHYDIVDALEVSVENALEALMMGGAVQPFARAGAIIEQDFRRFISSREAERVGIPGTPTQAALGGSSLRYKRPSAKRGRRPSFRNTGLYMGSFRAWVDQK